MRLDEFVQKAINDIKAGIDKSNAESDHKAAFYPDYVEFDLRVSSADDNSLYVDATGETTLRFVVGINQK